MGITMNYWNGRELMGMTENNWRDREQLACQETEGMTRRAKGMTENDSETKGMAQKAKSIWRKKTSMKWERRPTLTNDPLPRRIWTAGHRKMGRTQRTTKKKPTASDHHGYLVLPNCRPSVW